jgi:hypothetical protein
MECIIPPLIAVPEEEWFCAGCTSILVGDYVSLEDVLRAGERILPWKDNTIGKQLIGCSIIFKFTTGWCRGIVRKFYSTPRPRGLNLEVKFCDGDLIDISVAQSTYTQDNAAPLSAWALIGSHVESGKKRRID